MNETMDKDYYIITFPRSGTHWLMVMLMKYFKLHFDLKFPDRNVMNIKSLVRNIDKLPNFIMQHEDHPAMKMPNELMTSKHQFENKKVILFIRDPRDILVSHYFWRVNKRRNNNLYNGSISDFVKDKERVGNIDSLIKYYNIWINNRNIPKEFSVLRYEKLHEDTYGELVKILKFLDIEEINNEYIKEAIEFGSFGNMHKLESQRFFNKSSVKKSKFNMPESYLIRKGKVGEYKNYLNEEDIEYVDKQIQRLDDYFNFYK